MNLSNIGDTSHLGNAPAGDLIRAVSIKHTNQTVFKHPAMQLLVHESHCEYFMRTYFRNLKLRSEISSFNIINFLFKETISLSSYFQPSSLEHNMMQNLSHSQCLSELCCLILRFQESCGLGWVSGFCLITSKISYNPHEAFCPLYFSRRGRRRRERKREKLIE